MLDKLLNEMREQAGLDEAVQKKRNHQKALKAWNDLMEQILSDSNFPATHELTDNPAERKTVKQFHAALRNAHTQLNHWAKQKSLKAW